MTATTNTITTLGNIIADLDAIIFNLNSAFDVAHENNLPSEADELMMIKADVWTLRKKLVKKIDAIRQEDAVHAK